MSANPIFPIVDPSLRDLLLLLRQEIAYGFNCHEVGTIQSFDPTKQTATVTLNYLKTIYDQTPVGTDQTQANIPSAKAMAYPLLVDVPVFINSGGGGTLTFPISQGDTCLVLFNDRDLDGWFATGQTALPNSARAHDLADGLALVGFRCLANTISGYNTTDAQLAYNGGKIEVNSKINISNASQSLLTVLTDLITAIKGFTDTGGYTANPATITALTNVQTELSSLLK